MELPRFFLRTETWEPECARERVGQPPYWNRFDRFYADTTWRRSRNETSTSTLPAAHAQRRRRRSEPGTKRSIAGGKAGNACSADPAFAATAANARPPGRSPGQRQRETGGRGRRGHAGGQI